tara:strand:- start:613 stop:1104 length:492 start_codon:yes stop_codon:yes gene_type:complete
LKKILLISDTHGFLDEKIIAHCKNSDEIWHAGDIGNYSLVESLKKIKPLRAVYGNIDDQLLRNEFNIDCKFSIEQIKVWMTHIGGYPGKYNKRILNGLKEYKPDLFICGHSHILKIIYDKKHDFLHINPGAIGKHGFHQKRTMVRFNIDKGDLNNLEIIEYNR